MKYHTALRKESNSDKGVLEGVYKGKGLTIFQHSILGSVPREFFAADVVYSEVAWQAGYKKFTENSLASDSDFRSYIRAVESVIFALGVPSYIIAGKQMQKSMNPQVIHPLKFAVHKNIDVLLLAYNTSEKPPVETEAECIEWIAAQYKCVLDFCCGYSERLISAIKRNSKQAILTDINRGCLLEVIEKHNLEKEEQ